MGRRGRQTPPSEDISQMASDPNAFLEEGDLEDLNNPDVSTLSEPPLLGARPRPSEMFGDEADNLGRASSPKLYAQVAQFPTATQFRIWRMENGVPVGLGAIDCEATEEDFVRGYYEAMPRSGEGKFQFRLRPIDVRGSELGKEITIFISEHHATLRMMREMKKREREEMMNNGNGNGNGRDPVIVTTQGDNGTANLFAEEMGRMYEQAAESSERRAEMLQESLAAERERLRDEEKRRADERVGLAERSATVIQTMTERAMQAERQRADEVLQTERLRAEESTKNSREQGQMLLSTLTSVFQQQQEAARSHAERQREADAAKAAQDREFFDRQRKEAEDRRKYELEALRIEAVKKEESARVEAERLRESLKAEAERIKEAAKAEADKAKEYARLETERLRMETEKAKEQARSELERSREQAAMERERWRVEIEERRRMDQMDFDRRQLIEKERIEVEKAAIQRQREDERAERERRERSEQARLEMEKATLQRQREEEREERDRREKEAQIRWEREKAEMVLAEQRRKEDNDRRDALRADELRREEIRRKEELELKTKSLEVAAQRDREHSERMMEMARLEREAQREATQSREKAEREAREAREKSEREARETSDKERQRQYELTVKEMEIAKERDREHAERMMQMQKMNSQPAGLGGLTDMLGMDTPELLARIFGGGEGGEGGVGWADAIPKVLGTIADLGKAAFAAKQAEAKVSGRRQVGVQPSSSMMVPVQTPQGVRYVQADSMRPPAQQPEMELPSFSSIPPGQKAEESGAAPSVADKTESPVPEAQVNEAIVDVVARAKAAGVNLIDQRKARKAIRKMADVLPNAPQDSWVGMITEAMIAEPAIYRYIQAVTVRASLIEAKVENVDRIIKSLRDSAAVPEDVPLDEVDYARLIAKASEPAVTETVVTDTETPNAESTPNE